MKGYRGLAFFGGGLCAYGVVSWCDHGNVTGAVILCSLGFACSFIAEWRAGGFRD